MDITHDKIQVLIQRTDDHLEIHDHSVFLVNHPDFKRMPIVLVANIHFPNGRITYSQLYKLSPQKAKELGEALLTHYDNLSKLDNL